MPMLGCIRRMTFVAAVVTPLAGAGPTAAQSPYTHTVMINSGMPAPGTGAGITFGSASPPAMGPPIVGNGRSLVTAGLVGPGVTTGVNDVGLWSFSFATGLEYVSRDGDVAPGTGGALFDQSN